MTASGQVHALFRSFIREGKRFNNYNIREYILRRAREGFRTAASGAEQEVMLAAAKEELQVVKRQSVVYQLYGRPIKNVLELDQQKGGSRH